MATAGRMLFLAARSRSSKPRPFCKRMGLMPPAPLDGISSRATIGALAGA